MRHFLLNSAKNRIVYCVRIMYMSGLNYLFKLFDLVLIVCSQLGNNTFPTWERFIPNEGISHSQGWNLRQNTINNVAQPHRFLFLALLLHLLEVGSFLGVRDLLGSRSIQVCANAVGIRAGWHTYRRIHSLGACTY